MQSEKSRMLAGELYNPLDAQLSAERVRAEQLCRMLNATEPCDASKRAQILAELLGAASGATVRPPFFCDYGYNIRLGANVYFNFNCVVLDVMPVVIGSNALFGPAVQIYTALHPEKASERAGRLEFARPVTIGDDVWVGGGAILCPGVEIGARCVIGAGSIVVRSIPERVFAAGNPCRVIRALE